ncbi:hypothetical protein GGR56DRAFT_671028 [Xylariaceae sp. FL0804]|nr:hypothetical protein GGR56DRAFT_671028 [Xylariaceae sp. FL0804]
MEEQSALRDGISLIGGLTLDSRDAEPFEVPQDVYRALVSGRDLSGEHLRRNIEIRMAGLLAVCLQQEDNAEWPMEHKDIGQTVGVFVSARRRFLSLASTGETDVGEGSSSLCGLLDRWIRIADEIAIAHARPTRGARTLVAPKDVDLGARLQGMSLGAVIWPPAHFHHFDVAILGENTIRKQLFGINTGRTAEHEIEPQYPHDQSPVMEVRKYLCWLSLTQTTSDSKISLFLTPVAFSTHEERQRWHKATGHKSRLYATVDEFIEYADNELESREHVMCLFTPWFFEIDALVRDAAARNEAVPVVWEKTCFRCGMMLVLSKAKEARKANQDGEQKYRRLVFKPESPHYPWAMEPTSRREMQRQWMAKVLGAIDKEFEMMEAWTGGRAAKHRRPSRAVAPDSVEASSEIITEIMEDVTTLPSSEGMLKERGFSLLRPYG